MTKVTFDNQFEPIVIGKPLFDLLLKQDNFADLYSLYGFYYYTAKWQKTNIPKATGSYVQQGLKWTEPRFLKAKAKLKDLKLIEDFKARDPQTSKITGHYIKVNFIWSQEKTTLRRKPGHRKSKDVVNQGRNALSNGKRNALSNGKRNALSVSALSKKGIDEAFQRFWLEWPAGRRENKKKAGEAFARHSKSMPPIDELLEILRLHKKKPGWNEEVKYIPHPTTWINGHRWEDEIIVESSVAEEQYPRLTKKFISADIWSNNYKHDRKKISLGIQSIATYTDNLRPDRHGKIEMYYGTVYKMCSEYIKWLEDQAWIKEFGENAISPTSGLFKRFIKDQEKEFDNRIEFKVKK